MTEATKKVYGALPYIKPEAIARPDEKVLRLSRDNSPVMKQWLDGLQICFLYDEGQSFSYINHRDILKAGISEDGIYQLALENLSAKQYELHKFDNVYAVLAGGNFEASMVLNDDLLHFIDEMCDGHAIAAMPTRDVLAICPSSSDLGIIELRKVIRKLDSCDDHPITGSLLEYNNSGWKYYDG